MAEVKRLVDALHTLIPPTPANHQHDPDHKPQPKLECVSRSKHEIDVHIEIDTT